MSDWRIDGLYAEGPDGVSVDMDTLADTGEVIVEHMERDDCGGNYSARTRVPLHVIVALLRNKGLAVQETQKDICERCRGMSPLCSNAITKQGAWESSVA